MLPPPLLSPAVRKRRSRNDGGASDARKLEELGHRQLLTSTLTHTAHTNGTRGARSSLYQVQQSSGTCLTNLLLRQGLPLDAADESCSGASGYRATRLLA
ncbi:hypothetical protein MRX96_057565 [Rhipicephalus microplus]